MHYAIKYNQATRAERDANAIRDAIEYLGRDKWQTSFGRFIQPGARWAATPYSVKKQTIQALRFCCMFAGIRGYPVGAIMRGIIAAH